MSDETVNKFLGELKEEIKVAPRLNFQFEKLLADYRRLQAEIKELKMSEDEVVFQLGTLKDTLESYQRGTVNNTEFIQTMTETLIKKEKDAELLRVELTKKDKTIESLIRDKFTKYGNGAGFVAKDNSGQNVWVNSVSIAVERVEEEIESIQAELDKHKKAVKIALDFISAEGDCVEQGIRQEIEQVLKGD